MVLDIVLILEVILIVVVVFFIGFFLGRQITEKFWEKVKLPERLKQSGAVLGGQFSEQIAPYLPDFPYKPTEIRFVGKPVDFIVFNGLNTGEPEEIVFVEVNSGSSILSPIEKRVKELIEQKKVAWFEYRVPEHITKGQATSG